MIRMRRTRVASDDHASRGEPTAMNLARIATAGLLRWIVPILALSACTSARIGETLSPDDPDFPRVNPAAVRTVEIRGRVAPTLQLRLFANYVATNSEGCSWTPTLITGAFEGASFLIGHSEPLAIVRDGERFSARFTVDRFEPGRCGWTFGGVSAAVSKGVLRSVQGLVVRNASERPGSGKDTWYSNARDTPVVWRCRFSPLADAREGEERFACGEMRQEHRSKDEHRLTATARVVEFVVIDLESP